MRKFIALSLFFIANSLMASNSYAQNEVNDSIQQQRIDSLENAVKILSADIQESKDNERLKSIWGRKKFLNIGYVKQSLTPQYGNEFNSEFGASISSGRTIFLHKKPLFGVLKFGLDLGFDITYAKYKDYETDNGVTDDSQNNHSDYSDIYDDYSDILDDYSDLMNLGMHQADLGLLIGPSITINPVGHLMITGYFRFVPSYSMLILDEDFSGSYSSFFTYGGEISWKAIGVGIEGKHGSAKYRSFISDDDEKVKYTTNSLRAYICFRF